MQPEPFFFFSPLPSSSLIELTDEVLCDPVRSGNTDHRHETNPRGTALKQRVCTWEREKERERCKMEVIILVESPATASFCLCSKDIAVCLCVYGLLPAWLQGLSQSLSPHTVHRQPRWLPSASCRYSLQLFSIRRLLTPRAVGSAADAADMSRFQREQNKSP